MTETLKAADTSLRVSDLVPLRRMLGTDSVVIRVRPDGSFEPLHQMPSLFFDRSIRHIVAAGDDSRFEDACREAIDSHAPVSFRPDPTVADEVMINPILDDDGTTCRFLVCWVRRTDVLENASGALRWADLRLEDVTTRFRLRTDQDLVVVEAAPWWALPDGELLELWPHHTHVSAMGLGHAVMGTLITDAAEAAAELSGGPAVRIFVPSADMLAGLVPVFHGAVRASGIEPARIIVAIDVSLAVDPDLLPVIVHLRTMGMQIDIVGLDALTATLHTVSDTSSYGPLPRTVAQTEAGPWVNNFHQATSNAA